MLELASRLGSDARNRPLRANNRRPARPAAVDGRGRRQGSELRALSALARVARAAALPARRHAQAPGSRDRRQAGLSVARKPDSQDLCFLAGTRHSDFLERHGGLGARPGPIVDLQGTVLGAHRGAHSYTVGQRHGLGIGGYPPAVRARGPTPQVEYRDRRASQLAAARESPHPRVDAASSWAHAWTGWRVRSHGRALPVPRRARSSPSGRHARARIVGLG